MTVGAGCPGSNDEGAKIRFFLVFASSFEFSRILTLSGDEKGLECFQTGLS